MNCMIQRRLQNLGLLLEFINLKNTLRPLPLDFNIHTTIHKVHWFTNRIHQRIISLNCTLCIDCILLFSSLTRIFLNNGRLLHHLTNLNRRLSAILVSVCTIFSSGEIVSSIVSSISFSWGRVELENQRCSTSMISLKLHRKKNQNLAKLENDTLKVQYSNVLERYQACHMIYQLKIFSMNLRLTDQSESRVLNPVL